MARFLNALIIGGGQLARKVGVNFPVPTFTVQPSIAGSPVVGSVLTGTPGLATSALSRTLVWLRNGSAIAGANSATYVVQPADVGTQIALRVTATGPGGTTVATSPAVAAGTYVAPTLQRLSLSQPMTKGQAVPANATLLNRMAGSTFTTSIPGITIDNATGKVTGTPTAWSGLVTEIVSGVSRDTLLFAPTAAQHKMRVGMGMSGLSYYTHNYEWVDYVKCGSWASPPATADANGMPLTLGKDGNGNPGASMLVPFDDGTTTPVRYHVVTDGDMDLGFLSTGVPGAPANYSVSGVMTKETGGYTFTYAGGPVPQVNGYLIIKAIRTAPTYFHLVSDADMPRYQGGHTFKAAFVAEIAQFSWLRFMNWHGGNVDNVFTNTATSLFYSGAGQVPLTAIKELCLEAQVGCWLNLQAKITDSQLSSLYVPMLDALVSAGIGVYLEYTNEIWNQNFGQWAWASQWAASAGYTAANYSDYNSYYASTWWLGRRVAQMAMNTRGKGYRWLLGVQTVQAPYLSQILQEGINSVSGSQPTDFWGWYASWYCSGTISRNPGGALGAKQDAWIAANDVDAIFDNVVNYLDPNGGQTNSAADNVQFWSQNKTVANARGLKLLGYEGTIDLESLGLPNASTYDSVFFAMPANPLAQGALTQIMEVCEATGFDGLTCFDYASNPANSTYGRFGMKPPGYPLAAALAWQSNLAPTAVPTIDPIVVRAGNKFTFTARRTANLSNAETHTVTVGPSKAYAPAAISADYSQPASFTFAAGSATATFTVTSPNAIPE